MFLINALVFIYNLFLLFFGFNLCFYLLWRWFGKGWFENLIHPVREVLKLILKRMCSVLNCLIWIMIPVNIFQILSLLEKWVILIFVSFIYFVYDYFIIICFNVFIHYSLFFQDDSSSDNSSLDHHLYEKCIKDVSWFIYVFNYLSLLFRFIIYVVLLGCNVVSVLDNCSKSP